MQSTHFLNNIFSLGPTYTKILFPKCLLIRVQRGTLRREILDLCFHLPITTQVSFLINKNYMCFSCSTRCFDEYEEWYDYCCCCSVAQLCLTRQPHGLQPPGLPVPHHIPKFAQFMSIALVMPSSHLILWCPLLLLSSVFPSIRDFSNELAIPITWPKYWKMTKIQLQHQSFHWIFRIDFPLDWLGWYPCCPRHSQESSPAPQFEGISSLVVCLLYGPALTTVCDHWEDHSLYHMDLCQQSNASAFQHTV